MAPVSLLPLVAFFSCSPQQFSSPGSEVVTQFASISPTSTKTIHSFTTVYVPGDSTGASSNTAPGGSGLSTSDKIALGVGIGFGFPTLVVGIIGAGRMGYIRAWSHVN